MGIATFVIDSFTGRGIASVVNDQSRKLGRLVQVYDIYRALDVLAKHPRVDPTRIAALGFSRGGQGVLYASMNRFRKMHGTPGFGFAASVPFIQLATRGL